MPAAAMYAARGQEARSRDGQDVLYAARGHAYRMQVVERRREQAAEDARGRPDAALPPASAQASARRVEREPASLQNQ